MTPSHRIALALPMGVQHLERVVSGIRRYAASHTDWTFVTSPETHFLLPRSLEGWDGDGIISLLNTAEDIELMQTLNCPVINLSGVFEESPLPRVRVDYQLAGRKAAAHLLARGFQRFAFYGLKRVWYSRSIGDGFRSELEHAGAACDVLEADDSITPSNSWIKGMEELDQWLVSLKKPVAVLASHDPRASMVIDSCRRTGIDVPREVAVLGINNDTITCELCSPTLSSLARSAEEIGFEAARNLDRLLRGEKLEALDTVIPPGDVVERQSTDILLIEDPELARVVALINENLSRPLSIPEICTMAGVSRRWLEYAFQQTLQQSPYRYICEQRVRKAETLLREPSRRIKEIAYDCGFSSPKQMNTVFKRARDYTPRAFRESLNS